MIKAVIIFLLSLFSLNAMSLDLTYNLPLDPYYCDNNPPECQQLPSSTFKFDMDQKITKVQWVTFFTLQILDAYSTSRAIKYDCIREINPLYTERPSDSRIVATKTLILAPSLLYNDGYKKLTPEELNSTNMLYMFVVVNNFRLLNDAKQNCNKIR
jgi:hypothetical protein|tara:strand:- start:650 stop:1117 length:468 start_codon:yes stop_codon:yes gene_type:complete